MAEVRLPDLGGETKEAVVSYWHISAGAIVREGEDLVEVATDKATFNVPAPVAGKVEKIFAKAGDKVAIGGLLARIT